ncbi:MAG: OB-fold nucleic acid binding domain-containing protein, partial [candidate division NC10 bacterium]
VTALKEISTKSGDRMAFATLEDMGGSVEVTVFPEPFRLGGAYLRSGQPILVRGRVDGAEEGRKVLAEEIRPLESAAGASTPPARSPAVDPFEPEIAAKTCRILASGSGAVRELFQSIKEVCDEHRGRVPLFVHLLFPEREIVIRARALSVRPTADLVAKVEALLGQGSILVEYAERA